MTDTGNGGAPRSAEFIFVKSVKDGIPNKDPMTNDARRIFSNQDGRVSLSDVSIKRDVRDYIIDKHPLGATGRHIYVQALRNDEGSLLGRGELAKRIFDAEGVDPSGEDVRRTLLKQAFDARLYGVVFSVGGANFHETGPLQLSWAHSMHPVDTMLIEGTTTMPSGESTSRRPARAPRGETRRPAPVGGGGEDASPSRDLEDVGEADLEEMLGYRQGTRWESYIIPFAVYCGTGVLNHQLATATGLSEEDAELHLEALWGGTQNRQARGRGFQQPLFMMYVEYENPLSRIGYLEEDLELVPGTDAWTSGRPPTGVSEISLDATKLVDTLGIYGDRIARARYWKSPRLQISGNLSGVAEEQELF